MVRKFEGIFESLGARITDRLCRSELRQAGFSCDLCYPLVHTLRNAAQIANEIAAHFKTEFFNRIGRSLPVTAIRRERLLAIGADIQICILENG